MGRKGNSASITEITVIIMIVSLILKLFLNVSMITLSILVPQLPLKPVQKPLKKETSLLTIPISHFIFIILLFTNHIFLYKHIYLKTAFRMTHKIQMTKTNPTNIEIIQDK